MAGFGIGFENGIDSGGSANDGNAFFVNFLLNAERRNRSVLSATPSFKRSSTVEFLPPAELQHTGRTFLPQSRIFRYDYVMEK
jgi:hypothetical protein